MPPPNTGDPAQVALVSLFDVDVRAADHRVHQPTAFNDCCITCDHQNLLAMVPTANGPALFEADGCLPLRRKFCGTITKYAINDEVDDPRDFNINIRPAPVMPFPNFVAGLVRTDETPRFNSGVCDVPKCLLRASEMQNDPNKFLGGKVIHAELTPDEHFYGVDGRFLPIESSRPRCGVLDSPFPSTSNKKCTDCIDGSDCRSELEPSAQNQGAEACVYGVYAYDHGEHSAGGHPDLCCSAEESHDLPEMPPFDAIWWRHPDRNGWMFGVFQDDSNRYSFDHCGSQNNGNDWSQAPRDLTFRFPFKFPRQSRVQHACLRHVRTLRLKDSAANTVSPVNVTTGAFVNPLTEVPTLVIGGVPYLEVKREAGSELETHITVWGSIIGDDVVGEIILRVVVGCDDRPGGPCKSGSLFNGLKNSNPLVKYDKDDKGAGYFYSELTFQCDCP